LLHDVRIRSQIKALQADARKRLAHKGQRVLDALLSRVIEGERVK
jgi:hypothetical protein